MLGIGTSCEMLNEVQSKYHKLLQPLPQIERRTFNWANEFIQPMTSMALACPIYCYQIFSNSTLNLSDDELELEFVTHSNNTLGHLRVKANEIFCCCRPLRIYFEAAHFEALISRQTRVTRHFIPHRRDAFPEIVLTFND